MHFQAVLRAIVITQPAAMPVYLQPLLAFLSPRLRTYVAFAFHAASTLNTIGRGTGSLEAMFAAPTVARFCIEPVPRPIVSKSGV